MFTSQRRGFTLVEVLFVAAIVAILSMVIIGNVGEARKKARDTQRMTDLGTLQIALKLYRDSYGTYQVTEPATTGESGSGTGWVSYEGGTYTKSITEGLFDQGLIQNPTMDDPTLGSQGYVLFLCSGGRQYGLFARKERPTDAETTAMSSVCGGATAAAEPYNMNYGVGG
jgi:prepilin-type N-terminal cleavage/methylation domain-containing protein